MENNEAMRAALQNFVNGVETNAITSDHDETLAHAMRLAQAALAHRESEKLYLFGDISTHKIDSDGETYVKTYPPAADVVDKKEEV